MTDPPDAIKQNGVKTIMYLRNSLRSSKAYYTVKLMLVGRAEQGKTTLMHRLMRDYTYNINQSTNGTWKCLVLPVQLLREWRVLSVYIHIYCLQVANTTLEGGSWGYTYIKAQEWLATGTPPGFTSRTVFEQCRPCGISAISKKMPLKIYVASSNGAQKK